MPKRKKRPEDIYADSLPLDQLATYDTAGAGNTDLEQEIRLLRTRIARDAQELPSWELVQMMNALARLVSIQQRGSAGSSDIERAISAAAESVIADYLADD